MYRPNSWQLLTSLTANQELYKSSSDELKKKDIQDLKGIVLLLMQKDSAATASGIADLAKWSDFLKFVADAVSGMSLSHLREVIVY